MERYIEFFYDSEMNDLLKSEGISTSLVQKIISNFVEKNLLSVGTEEGNFLLPFVNEKDNRYTLYGNYRVDSSKYIFEIELLGISIKNAKNNPCNI